MSDLLPDPLRTDVLPGDGTSLRPGKPGPAADILESNELVNAIRTLIAAGRLSAGAIVPNTPEGRAALAGSTELSAALGPGGTAGNISKQTAQGVALVQALILGGN